MQFPDPLIGGRLERRYKRFLSDVTLDDGREIVAHCANPGSMMGLAAAGSRVWLSPSRNPARKLKYSWELVEVDRSLVGINTGRANALVAEGLDAGKVPELAGYARRRAEVRYGTNSRVDFLLQDDQRCDCYLEVKSVTLSRRDGLAEFPDAVTARGAKHLVELTEMVRQGHRAVLFFLVQRGDCTAVAPAADIDPGYAETLSTAREAGLEILCYQCNLSVQSIALDAKLPLTL